MLKTQIEILQSYSNTFRDLINSKMDRLRPEDKTKIAFSTRIRRQFKFNTEDDWGHLCACMDLVGDTSLGIENFQRFSFGGPTKYNDLGELYIRLYGLLNAVYLQQMAVLNMCRIMKVSHIDQHKESIGSLQITTIRHKLGSHTVNYLDNDKNQMDWFVIVRAELESDKLSYMSYRTDESFNVNLEEILEKHISLMIDLMDKVLEKSITTIYKTSKVKKREWNKELELLRRERDGDFIIRY